MERVKYSLWRKVRDELELLCTASTREECESILLAVWLEYDKSAVKVIRA
jgi:hypothetical protein